MKRIYDAVEEFGMPVPEMQNAAYQTMESEWSAMRTALSDADAAKEANIASWSAQLESAVQALRLLRLLACL